MADPISPGGWNPRPDHFGMTREYKVLELFLYGGMSPWETFYVRDLPNWADRTALQPAFAALTWDCSDVTDGNLVSPSRLFTQDEAGHDVYLGPATTPLFRAPTQLVNRMRLVVLQHDLLPHEAAIPYAMTGLKLGNPRLSGLGAPLFRRAKSIDPTAATPRSYSIIPDPFFAADNLTATTSVGAHPADNRPLPLKIGPATAGLIARLTRSGFSASRDSMLDLYADIYREQMSWPSRGPLRSKHFASYEASLRQVFDAPALSTLLDPSLLAIGSSQSCVYNGASPPTIVDRGHTSLRLAAHLLNAGGAKYVGVVDNGRLQAGGAGYDVHGGLALVTSTNLYSILHELETLVSDSALDLNDTLVVINTEFGRTPLRGGADGRDHYPLGYAVALLGGPIAARGIAGSMTSSTVPVAMGPAFSPTDVIGGVLLAAGINPTHPNIFAVGDFTSRITASVTESSVRRELARRILGLTV